GSGRPVGHVVNVFRDGDLVVFLDAQVGGPAVLPGDAVVEFLPLSGEFPGLGDFDGFSQTAPLSSVLFDDDADTEDETAGDEADGSGAVVGMFRPPPQPAAPPMPAAAAVTTAGQLAENLAAVAGQANALFAGLLVNPPPGVNTAAHAGLVQPLAAALWTFNVTQQLVTGFGARLQWLQQWA